jgi:hypothetical protein
MAEDEKDIQAQLDRLDLDWLKGLEDCSTNMGLVSHFR